MSSLRELTVFLNDQSNALLLKLTCKHIQNVPCVHALRTKLNETLRKMCNLPFSFLSVICSPLFVDLFSVCSLEGIEDGFSSWFHSISQQHLKGVVIALHLISVLRGFLHVFEVDLHQWFTAELRLHENF